MNITNEIKTKIRNNMIRLFDEYDYSYNTSAIDKIIDTWLANKADLIELLSKHPNYVEGEFLIAFNQNYNREIDEVGAEHFARWVRDNVDFIREHWPKEQADIMEKEKRECGSPNWYDQNYPLTYALDFFINRSYLYAAQFVSERMAYDFNLISGSLRIKEGQKMSRAINKLCTYLGLDKHPDYNKEFAKYADSVNPLKIVRHTVFSLNPIDYLTMSFGNSWASCHTIDKKNRRGMPNSYEGQYSSGTMSYMLDGTSIVFYTVTAAYDGNEYYFEDKINRCMFHYGEHKLVQGRVYPQDNDNDDCGIYKDIREIAQKIIADCEGFDNYWTTKRGPEEIHHYVCSKGTHYHDYLSYDNCRISFPKHIEDDGSCITIGHEPICIECGCHHTNNENINCCHDYVEICACCGEHIHDSDDVYWVRDEPYCRDCVTYCDYCNDYELANEVQWIDSVCRNVCEYCLETLFTYCDHCNEYHHNDYVVWLGEYDEYVCDDCLDEYYTRCDVCGEYFLNEDITHDSETGLDYCCECYAEKLENEEEELEEEEA